MVEGISRERSAPVLPLRVAARAERWVDSLRMGLRRWRKHRSGRPLEILTELDWRLGDEVMALPVYEALHRRHPGARVSARVRYPELLQGNPFVAAVNPTTTRPDLVLALGGERPGEPRRVTLARLSGACLDGLRPRLYLDPAECRELPFPELSRLARPWVVLHPAATQPCKEWGRERWREIGRRLLARGVSVVEVGAGRAPLGIGVDLVNRTGVRELARVLAAANLVIGDDSGPLHLARAAGTRVVGLFGATDPALLHQEGPDLVALSSPARCRFCWPRRTLAWPSGICPLAEHECMAALAVDGVEAAILSLLEREMAVQA